GAHVDQLTACSDVIRRQAAVYRGVIRQAVGSVAFVPRVRWVAGEGISPYHNANAAHRRTGDREGVGAIGGPAVAAGVAARGTGVVGRKETLPARRAVLV